MAGFWLALAPQWVRLEGRVWAGPAPATGQALVIRADRGGGIAERLREVDRLRQSGQRVELRGRCYSACTLYLGLENVCVAPQAVLGFHGPSWHGKPLTPSEFERWSAVFAEAYKPPLRLWYLRIARHELTEPLLLRGSALIRLGYAAC